MCVCVCVRARVHACVYCVLVCPCACTHTHTHTHTDTHTRTRDTPHTRARKHKQRHYVFFLRSLNSSQADQNVIVVDWGRGAFSINYLQVAANTRLVARMLAAMLRKFMQIGARPAALHLIGVSLGAHIAGYVGSEIDGIGRITGKLTPSLPQPVKFAR